MKENGRIACPVCKTMTFQADNGLAVNSNMQVVIERWQDQRHRTARGLSRKPCGICEDAVATKRCEQCDGDLCEACVATSHAKGFFKNHTIVDLMDTRAPAQPVLCQVHKEEKVGFYCTDCSMAVCSHCILLGDHQDHSNMPIARAVQEQRDVLRSQVERLQTRKKGNQLLSQDLRVLEEKVCLGGSQQRAMINRQIASLKDLIDSKADQLLSKSNLEEEQKLSQVRGQYERTAIALDQVDVLLRRTDEMLLVDNDYDFLTLVLPLIQDSMRCSSQVVEAVAQVPTTFRALTIDAQTKSMNELDLGGGLQDNRRVMAGSTSASPQQASVRASAASLVTSGASVAASSSKLSGSSPQVSRAVDSQARSRAPIVTTASAKTAESASQAQVVRTVYTRAPAEKLPSRS